MKGNYNGTWKLGVFLINGPDNTGSWVDYHYDSSSATSRVPISTLFTSFSGLADSDFTSGVATVPFQFSTFAQGDKLLQKHARYELILWYDNDDSGDVNQIDVEKMTGQGGYDWIHFKEHHMACGGLRLDDVGVIYNTSYATDSVYETIVSQFKDYTINCEFHPHTMAGN